jgi:hypothetical protein
MRVIAIILVLIAGIATLLMSVCGGFFFLAGAFQSARSLIQGGPQPSVWQSATLMLIAAPFLILGGAACWLCFRFIGRRLSGRE